MQSQAAYIQAISRGYLRRCHDIKMNAAARWIQAHVHGMTTRVRTRKQHTAALSIQKSWRRWQALLDVKILLYEKIDDIYCRRRLLISEKLKNKSVVLIQRNFRKFQAYQRCVALKIEKAEADNGRTTTTLVAMYSAAAHLRHFVHPFWRHLPLELQEALEHVKGSAQRAMAMVPIGSGKLGTEMIGKKSLRHTAADLVAPGALDDDRTPELVSQMLLSITRHLMSQMPAEHFGTTVNWASYAIAHQAVDLLKSPMMTREEIVLGVEVPPRKGEPLATLWEDKAMINHNHDRLTTVMNENIPLLFLRGIPDVCRITYVTAETLITVRQALDNPELSTEDHLAFQGVDNTVGAQLMDCISSDIDSRLPYDWPKQYGTIMALSVQTSRHVGELEPPPQDQFKDAIHTRSQAGQKSKGPTPAGTTPAAKAKSG